MNILKLDHAALLVQDIEQSRQFYCEVLGMDEIPSGGNCWLRNGSAEVHLLDISDPGISNLDRQVQLFVNNHLSENFLAQGHISHIAFEVDDLESAQQHLKKHHISIACGPRPRRPEGEQLYFCDPDGYVIELFVRK